jgi:hypothetical protein
LKLKIIDSTIKYNVVKMDFDIGLSYDMIHHFWTLIRSFNLAAPLDDIYIDFKLRVRFKWEKVYNGYLGT